MGIRQGDPMSLVLFTVFFDLLSQFQEVIDKMRSRLSRWKGRLLFQAGRVILIKSVAQAQPVYIMQMYLLSITICDKLDQLMRNFC